MANKSPILSTLTKNKIKLDKHQNYKAHRIKKKGIARTDEVGLCKSNLIGGNKYSDAFLKKSVNRMMKIIKQHMANNQSSKRFGETITQEIQLTKR